MEHDSPAGWSFDPRSDGCSVLCRWCAERGVPENVCILGLLTYDHPAGRWDLGTFRRQRSRRSRIGGGEKLNRVHLTHHGREVVSLRCPVCHKNCGNYSPRSLGRRAERGEVPLLLPDEMSVAHTP